jgi:hypothetical protein
MAAHSRHEAAEHIKESSKTTPLWILLTFGAVVLAVLLGLATFMGRVSEDARYTRALNDPQLKPIATTFARMGRRHAGRRHEGAVGARVGGHRPKEFGAEMRVVRLKGRASSPWPRAWSSPFRVKAGSSDIVATGTAFTVKAAEDSSVTVVVSEGSVKVGKLKKLTDVPAGGAVVAKDTLVRQATAAEKEEATAGDGHAGRERQAARPGAQPDEALVRSDDPRSAAEADGAEGELPRVARLDPPGDPGHRGDHRAAVQLRGTEHGVHGAGFGGGEGKKK